MAQRYIFDDFDFRLRYTMQRSMEKEMLQRFCCGMEPTSMKKQCEIFLLKKQMIEKEREREREREREKERERERERERREVEGAERRSSLSETVGESGE